MKILSSNKNAKRNYEFIDKYVAGIELAGTEVKSISHSNCSINEAYINISKNEAYILNMYVAPFFEGNLANKNPNRNRKLLLHKSEIIKLGFQAKKDSLTIVPTKIYWCRNKIKVEIILGRGKKLYDKRQDIKKRDEQRHLSKY